MKRTESNRGSLPIILSVSVATVFGLSAASIQVFSRARNYASVREQQGIASFFPSETAALHGYFVNNLVPGNKESGEPQPNIPYTVLIENRYRAPTGSAQSPSSYKGQKSLQYTQQFDQSNTLITSYTGSNLSYKLKKTEVGTDYCGDIRMTQKNLASSVCLAVGSVTPPPPLPLPPTGGACSDFQCPVDFCEGLVTCSAVAAAEPAICITSQTDLENLQSGKKYILGADITLTPGYRQIPAVTDVIFNGNGHTIRDLKFTAGYQLPTFGNGLFRDITNSAIYDLTLESFDIDGRNAPLGAQPTTGSVVGILGNGSCVDRVAAQGKMFSSRNGTGGLVGKMGTSGGWVPSSTNIAAITRSRVDVVIDNTNPDSAGYVAGLVGVARYNSFIWDSHAKTTISGKQGPGGGASSCGFGGLVGLIEHPSEIRRSSAAIDITAHCGIGGLVGDVANPGPLGSHPPETIISQSFAKGKIGLDYMYAGGLVGIANRVRVIDSYAHVDISGGPGQGGLISQALNQDAGVAILTRAYAVSNFTRDLSIPPIQYFSIKDVDGVFFYSSSGPVSVSRTYWNVDLVPVQPLAVGTPRNTFQMKNQATYVGWDFANVWKMDPVDGYPKLRWEP